MAENGRLSKMNEITAAFGKIMSAHRGEVLCSVTTAKVCFKFFLSSCNSPSLLVLANKSRTWSCGIPLFLRNKNTYVYMRFVLLERHRLPSINVTMSHNI